MLYPLGEQSEQSSDTRQLTVKLRRGVQFHSGRELTSEDVAYSLARPLDPKLQIYARQALARGLIAFDRKRGYRGPIDKVDVTGDWGQAIASRHAGRSHSPRQRCRPNDDRCYSVARTGLQPCW